MGAPAHPNRENQAIYGVWHTGTRVARTLSTHSTPALMLASNVYASTSTRNRRRSGARTPFAARRTVRTTHRPSPNLRLVPTTAPAPIALAA